MTSQGETSFGQYLLPLVASANLVALLQKPFRLRCSGEPRELGAQWMLGAQKGLLAIKDWSIAHLRTVPSSHPETLKMDR
jgi:hypothetical protein